MSYQSIEEIRKRCEAEGIEFWKAVQLEDCNERGASTEDSWNEMTRMWRVMCENVDAYEPDLVSRSGLVGKEGGRMEEYQKKGDTLCGDFIAKVMTVALKMGCNNACMKRIIAAPTAGACGVLPAVLIPYFKENEVPEETMVEAMYVAAGVGQVIANRAFLAGAAGGCQAEIGSACAMGAALYAWILGLNNSLIEYAAEMGLEHNLGLTCDPVGGYVQIPCIERNGYAALRAIDCAIYAKNLGYVRKNKVSFDAVVNVMKNTGHDLNKAYKETSLGGLALEFDL